MPDAWLELVLRQCILYSLPVVVSLSIVGLLQSKAKQQAPFDVFLWHGSYLPLLLGIVFHRGVLIALPQMSQPSLSQASRHVLIHFFLCGIGYLLYQWTMPSVSDYGLPPLHHWWSKIFMFYNLCMLCLHVLPLPGLFVGELICRYVWRGAASYRQYSVPLLCLAVVLTLLELSLGSWVIYPIYEQALSPSFGR
ncbi:MAG: hypothetical protein Q9M28_07545 [Mariprofundaceae bacterium]|nr:hypothetical protein [Mariprofundaceae bacterium]